MNFFFVAREHRQTDSKQASKHHRVVHACCAARPHSARSRGPRGSRHAFRPHFFGTIFFQRGIYYREQLRACVGCQASLHKGRAPVGRRGSWSRAGVLTGVDFIPLKLCGLPSRLALGVGAFVCPGRGRATAPFCVRSFSNSQNSTRLAGGSCLAAGCGAQCHRAQRCCRHRCHSFGQTRPATHRLQASAPLGSAPMA